MQPLFLHEFHENLNACFSEVNGMEVVAHHGDVLAEHAALCATVGVLDLSFRGRICLTGADRTRFLHGQVTNDVKRLGPGDGCYAALTTAKGKMECDLSIHCLAEELLLDFEPGLTASVSRRLASYIVADDVQIADVAPHYGLLTVQGPKAVPVIESLALFPELPGKPFSSFKVVDATLGEIHLVNRSRLDSAGFDLFVPLGALAAVADKLIAAAKVVGGGACGWDAFETARIEAGIPRFGMDMDDTNIPIECGIENQAINYSKGCYIGQEVLNRIHTLGHVNRELRGLRLANDLPALPRKGDRLLLEGKEIGHITSAVKSPRLRANVALGYVRKEANRPGTQLTLLTSTGESSALVVMLPFDS